MDKRTVIAIGISILILVGYQAFISKMYPPAQQEVTNKKPAQESAPVTKTKAAPAMQQSETDEQLHEKETDKFILVFSSIGGKIKEVIVKDYNKKILERDIAVIEGFENAPFAFQDKGNVIIMSYQDKSLRIIKKFTLYNEKYGVDLEISFINQTPSYVEKTFRIYNSKLDLKQYSKREIAGREKYFMEFSIATQEKVLRRNFGKAAGQSWQFDEKVEWAGVRDRYFCTILAPFSPISSAFTQPLDKQSVVSGIETAEVPLNPGAQYNFNAKYYIGPQNITLLEGFQNGFQNIVSFGTFDVISQGLLYIMRFMHSYLKNWGICIILISLLIYFVLFPLTAKSLVSMKRMQLLQPEIEKLREAFKDQPQKLNKELMELYRENKVNPFSGCLPMFLQIPVFFGLYQALMRSIELKGASFLWIKDLAEPDRLFVLKSSFPVIEDEINLLPLIMLVAMFLQQKLSMKSSASSTMQEQQKMMMFLFPLLFGFLFYHFPSGLTLYWVSYTILSIFSQQKINRKVAS